MGWNQEKAGPSRREPAYKILLLSLGKREGCPSNLIWHFVRNRRSSLRSPENMGAVRDFGFLMVVLVGEDRPFVILMLQGIVPVFQRVMTRVEGFQGSFEIIGAGFKGAKAVNEVIPHPQGNRDCGVEVRLESK